MERESRWEEKWMTRIERVEEGRERDKWIGEKRRGKNEKGWREKERSG